MTVLRRVPFSVAERCHFIRKTTGQSSAGFISLTGLDNGCNQAKAAGFPLHTAYTNTQLSFALQFLRSNHHTRVVTLMLGGNDLLLCQASTADGCTSQKYLIPVLNTYRRNLTKILKAIRNVYDGKLVIFTYYSLNYRDPVVTGAIFALNDVAKQLADQFDGTIANGFAAFASIATDRRFAGDPCAAGLLIKLQSGCDKHPTAFGAQVLADTLVAAVRHPAHEDDADDENSGDRRTRWWARRTTDPTRAVLSRASFERAEQVLAASDMTLTRVM